jgi:hypothetical protein
MFKTPSNRGVFGTFGLRVLNLFRISCFGFRFWPPALLILLAIDGHPATAQTNSLAARYQEQGYRSYNSAYLAGGNFAYPDDHHNGLSKKLGATAGLSSSASNYAENTAGQASSGTPFYDRALFQPTAYGATESSALFAPPLAANQPASYLQPPEQTDPVVVATDQKPAKKPSRPGPHQGTWVTGTWLAGDDLGMTDVETRTVWGFPFFTAETPLIITPGFGAHYWDGPTMTDAPPVLYDAYLQFRWLRQITPLVAADVSVTPGVYSDFERGRDESIRIAGRAISMIEWSPSLKFALGIIYLDRNDVNLLPAGGLIWTPHDDARFELIFPRPRLAWRWPSDCPDDPCADETWCYLAGEFGGGSWAIQRAGGADDEITYRDYRVVLGVERKTATHFSTRLEVAYVFGRELEYLSPTPDFQPDDTVMLRVAVGI